MKASLLRKLLVVLVVVAVVLVFALAGLHWWLSTEVGRGLVETRLSAAMGRPVRLDGEFSIGVLPLPGARGTDLRIFSTDGRWKIVDAGSYSVSLSLRPLLRGEVEVVALNVSDAGVDLAKIGAEPSIEAPGESVYFSFPEISSFELETVALYFDGLGSFPYVSIEMFSVDQFRVGDKAEFKARLGLHTEAGGLLQTAASGNLTLRTDGHAEAELESLNLEFSPWRISGMEGMFSADLVQSVFFVTLAGEAAGQTYRLEARIGWGRKFAEGRSGYEIEALDVWIADQRIAGSGCVLDASPPELSLRLSASVLDLSRLQALVDAWRTVAQSSDGLQPGGQALNEQVGDDTDLPFDLRLMMAIERAHFGDVVGEGVKLTAGNAPHCPGVR